MNSNWTISCRKPPADDTSKFGNTLWSVFSRSGDLTNWLASAPLAAASARPNRPRPKPQVHGPLIATLLAGFAADCRAGERMVEFDFRGLARLFVDQPAVLEAHPGADPSSVALIVTNSNGERVTRASARFREPCRSPLSRRTAACA